MRGLTNMDGSSFITCHRCYTTYSWLLGRRCFYSLDAKKLSFYFRSYSPFPRKNRSLDMSRNFHTNKGVRILFLGTPLCAAKSLQRWLELSQQNPYARIVSVITQSPSEKPSRKRNLSPVHEVAIQNQIPVWTPENIRDTDFLSKVQQWEPDIAITAAYGKLLSPNFLNIPKYGVVNIHPSLLPKFRGAAPVQRALQQGIEETGVSILFTVTKMDAGPIIAQEKVSLNGDELAGPLLIDLFLKGTDLLAQHFNSILNGTVQTLQQNEEEATYAPKLKKEEGWLSFHENAWHVHNKVRAFGDSIGTFANFDIQQKGTQKLKIYKTRLKKMVFV
ncbi:methionyl-tRNA formyltransferase [Galdieria sulphuraria]|uniref:methionyl-tRNA formyltransferase n=1 Tax=Galdieria sulphuraria TaxID=130081 RepID=M2WU65_GALSU|nr:methionyl-tRNA formyltransferase [Galdieria sulphuraria]EME27450.1 methionyl-tRNA formyltransferase [Galdieria sulphuraria]|eukprot:XP_005703970.1 methionyl-tRNA formyltransferase [Galdieria sulphuraria]